METVPRSAFALFKMSLLKTNDCTALYLLINGKSQCSGEQVNKRDFN
jgi:hypothetical protein